MTISINWPTRVITIPQDFLTPLGGSNYELDINAFRLALKELEDDADGMGFPDTHRHNTAVVLSGVTYARTFEIINGYTVTFENGNYSVRCIGANHNIADVKNMNSVSLIIGNSAGLISVAGAGTTAEEIWDYESRALTDKEAFGLAPSYDPAKTAAQAGDVDFLQALLNNRQEIQNIGGTWYLVTYDDNDETILVKSPLLDHEGNPLQPVAGIPSRRGRGV